MLVRGLCVMHMCTQHHHHHSTYRSASYVSSSLCPVGAALKLGSLKLPAPKSDAYWARLDER